MTNKAQQLKALGQSIWYDNIQRKLLLNGDLAGMVARGEIYGVTSNPSIFHNAITKSGDYDQALKPLAVSGKSSMEIYESLAIADIQAAADLFLPLYSESEGLDGYVSLEVNPNLAHDTEATSSEAQRLWDLVDRPNLMVKIPATSAGIPAIESSIAAGINVNVTLIFSQERYAEVMAAYLSGLEKRLADGNDLSRIASVASFFISRIDNKVDASLEKIGDESSQHAKIVKQLLGQVAVANAKLAYQRFKQVFEAARFTNLAAHGARFQRPLWASTSTKNPAYSDVKYVEELVGPNSVNTVPPDTLAAFEDHGQVNFSLEADVDRALQILRDLELVGVSLPSVTQELEVEGVKAFADAFAALLAGIDSRRSSMVG